MEKDAGSWTDYQAAYEDPLQVVKGERLVIQERPSPWPQWCRGVHPNGKGGWIPRSYVAQAEDGWVALRDYRVVESSVSMGQVLTCSLQESGWLWATDPEGNSGWVPLDHVELL